MQFPYFSRNGQLLPLDEAKIPLSLIEYQYGFGVYESVRSSGGITYFLADHAARLIESARIIGLEHEFTAEFVETSARELLEHTAAAACNLKILLIGGASAAEAQLFILCLNPLFVERKLYRDGAAMITYEAERVFPQAKSLNMLTSYMAYRQAREAGAYDALLVNRHGYITEGTRTNFFCIRGEMIYTPHPDDILLGITRKALLKAASNANFTLEEANIRPNELAEYEGVFITSTSSKIVPVRSVDGVVVHDTRSNGLVRLMEVFDQFLKDSQGVL